MVKFTAHSVSLFIDVLNEVGYTEIVAEMAGKTGAEIKTIMKDEEVQRQQTKHLIELIFNSLGCAEEKLHEFLADVTGTTDIKKMGFREYEAIRKSVFEHEDFRDFFMSAQRTAVDLFAALK